MLNSLAIVYRSSGRYDKAAETYRHALDQFETTSVLEPLNVYAANHMGISALNLGNILMRQRRHNEAAESYKQASRMFQRQRKDFPLTATFQSMAARTRLSLGLIHAKRKDYLPAEKAYRQAIATSKSLTALHGRELTTMDTHAASLTDLGNLLKKQNRISEAIELFEESIDLRKEHAAVHPEVLGNLKSMALTQANLADLHIDQEQYELANPLLFEAEESVLRMLNRNSKDPTFVRVTDFVYSLKCQLMSGSGRHEKVIRCVEMRMQLPDTGPNVALKAVGWLKRATELLKADDYFDGETKRRQLDNLARCAIGLIGTTIDSGWTPDPESRDHDSEQLQWLLPYPGLKNL